MRVFVHPDGGGVFVAVGRQPGGGGHFAGDGIGEGQFRRVGTIEQLHQHVVALILIEKLLRAEGSGDEEMQMILVHQGGIGGVSPGFGVKMQADYDVGLDAFVDEPAPAADFPTR